MRQIIRGDVIYVDLGQHPKSSIQSGIRPCVVVSNNINNKYSKVLSVCPCTSIIKKINVPTHIIIEPEQVKGYFERTSLLIVEQITAVSKNKVISRVGNIPINSKVMNQIDIAIARQLGIGCLKH